jgi:pyruvate/2-oxoglutarate/acetoin dehydrogenase E1 component
MPGMKIAVPSNPYDAKGLLTSAIQDLNPVVFFEHTLLSNMEGEIPEEPYMVPFGVANIVREGVDVTVLAIGRMVSEAAKAADALEGEISVEVIDPRTLIPLDEEMILRSIAKTGRLVVVDEDYERCGFSAEVAAVVAEKGYHNLKAPIARVANPNIPIPFNKKLEQHILPNSEKIMRAIRNVVKYSN